MPTRPKPAARTVWSPLIGFTWSRRPFAAGLPLEGTVASTIEPSRSSATRSTSALPTFASTLPCETRQNVSHQITLPLIRSETTTVFPSWETVTPENWANGPKSTTHQDPFVSRCKTVPKVTRLSSGTRATA